MRRPLAALLLATTAFAVTALLQQGGLLDRLELIALDARYATGIGRKGADNDIVIAWIDQPSMDYTDAQEMPFPWPRSVYAEAMQYMLDGGARAVVFDVLFDQRGGIATDDAAFGEALTAAHGDVLAMKFMTSRTGARTQPETQRFAGRALAADARRQDAARRRERGVTLPIPELEHGADQLGFVNITPDADKVYRHYDVTRLWAPPEQPPRPYPSLALAALLASGGAAKGVDDRLLLNFRGPEFTYPHVKFVNIFESINLLAEGKPPLYPAARFKDKIVLVGINAEGYEDIHPTPLSRVFPGVELHATALDNLRHGDALRELPWSLPLAAAAAGAATAAVFALPTGMAMLALILLALAFAAATLLAFASLLVVPMAAPALGGALSAGSALWYRLVVEGRQKREMRRAFSSYMAPEVLSAVLQDPSRVALGGEAREVTMLFSDLAGFTGLSEQIGPEALVRFLNDYFTRMCEPVLQQHGIIDKFIGDAIMAMFGAPLATPDHALRAVRAALAARAVSERIAAELQAQGKPTIMTRIGVHSGPAVVGNMGSSRRFDYTAIGDTVNLASRLEGANKAFGTACLVSDSAWTAAAGEVLGREVGRITVKGRQQPLAVFEPLALLQGASVPELQFADRWRLALAALRGGDGAAARAQFAALQAMRPGDVLCGLYLQRLQQPGWDGVFRLDSK